MELRSTPRFPLHCSMLFSTGQTYGEGTVVNISAGGWMIESGEPVQPGRYVTAHIRLPDQKVPLKVYLAVVRWAGGGKFGLTPGAMAINDWKRLRHFAAYLNESAAAGL